MTDDNAEPIDATAVSPHSPPDADPRGARRTSKRVLTDGGEEETEDEEGEGTSLVYLDLEGLFVDLLGVQIDLSEIELDLSVTPGSGNLLGNLLSGVAGLLDDIAGSLGGLLPEGGSGGLLPDIEVPSTSDVLFGAVNVVLDALLDALGDDGSDDSAAATTENDEDEGEEDGDGSGSEDNDGEATEGEEDENDGDDGEENN
jgi:hypothetical protein